MQEAPETIKLSIPELKQERISVELVGLTGLIVHRFGESAIDQIQRSQDGSAKVKKEPRDPDKEFREALYVLDGDRWGDLMQCRFGFPTRAIKRAIVTAGQRFADEKGTELMGIISPLTTMVEIQGFPQMRTDMVRLSGPSRTTSLAYRPEFDPWRMVVPLAYLSGMVTLDQVINLVRIAGVSVGLGDWRVDRKGVNGQFAIGSVQVNPL